MITHQADRDPVLGTVFSEDHRYRYALFRQWNGAEPYVAFIGLNPSTADASNDDPTIRRCINFAKDWGYGGIVMVNLFALRATDPKDMMADEEPIGPNNDYWIKFVIDKMEIAVAAWGAQGGYMNRDVEVLGLDVDRSKLYHLGLTKQGKPRHPLYLRKDTVPTRWARKTEYPGGEILEFSGVQLLQ